MVLEFNVINLHSSRNSWEAWRQKGYEVGKLGSGVRGRMSKAIKKNPPQRTRRSRVGAYPYPFQLKAVLGKKTQKEKY